MDAYLGWFVGFIDELRNCIITLAGISFSVWDLIVWSMFASVVCGFLGKYIYGE